MNENRVTLPKPIGKLLSNLPVYPGSLLFAAALNLALRDSLPMDVKRSLEGKRLCIRYATGLPLPVGEGRLFCQHRR